MSSGHFDHIVVGGGINGTWAAYHLAKRGLKTLLLEQFPLPHSRGSSHGQSRIIRTAYPQAFQRRMAEDSYPLWRTLELETDTELIKTTGLLVFGAEDEPHLCNVIKTFQESKSTKYRIYGDQTELETEFPMMKPDDNFRGIFDEEAGILRADKALAAARKMALEFGCTVLDSFQVKEIVAKSSDLVHVRGADGKTFSAKSVVVAAGPWASKMLQPLGLSLPLSTQKMAVCYFRVLSDFLPCTFVTEDPVGEHVYGLPEMEYPGLVKICLHRGVEMSPDLRDSNISPAELPLLARLKDVVSRRFPGLDPEPAVVETCMYTVTPDECQVVDLHPAHANIVVAAGFSGMGFKMAPVTGEILADFAMGKNKDGLKYDLEPMSARRFAKSKI